MSAGIGGAPLFFSKRIWSLTCLLLMLAIVSGFLFWETYGSAVPNRNLKRMVSKVEAKFAEWRNLNPRPVLLTARLIGSGAFVEAVKGAQISAVESTSGYASLADRDGRFIIPHMTWFPGARYTLFISTDIHNTRCVRVQAPQSFPDNGIVDAGDLQFDTGIRIPATERPISYIRFDPQNSNYYRKLFERLTEGLDTDHQRVDAISKYVATRRNDLEKTWGFKSARQILERGSQYCSDLAFAMAAITAAGGYPTRTVHTSDTPQYLQTHVAVEVYYDYSWHLYDPTYGEFFLNRTGEVASYRDLRLDLGLINFKAFESVSPVIARGALSWMPQAYASGFHQLFYVRDDEFSDRTSLIGTLVPAINSYDLCR